MLDSHDIVTLLSYRKWFVDDFCDSKGGSRKFGNRFSNFFYMHRGPTGADVGFFERGLS